VRPFFVVGPQPVFGQQAHRTGSAMKVDQLLHDADHAGAGDRRPDLDRQALPIALVDDVERAEATAADPSPAPPPPAASRTALQFSGQHVLDCSILQGQVRVHPLEL